MILSWIKNPDRYIHRWSARIFFLEIGAGAAFYRFLDPGSDSPDPNLERKKNKKKGLDLNFKCIKMSIK